MTPQVTLSRAREMAFKAYIKGSDVTPMHGDCSEPKHIELRGVEMLLRKQLATLTDDPFVDWIIEDGKVRWLPGRAPHEAAPPMTTTVVASVRCRRCKECLRAKRRLWTARAYDEVRSASRTWFVTLTVGPDRRLWANMVARSWCETARREAFDKLTPLERTRALAAAIDPEVTRWLKRVRKQSGATLRYLLVVEPHKDGFPHYHLLVHEAGQQCGERILRRQWKYGWCQAKLVAGEVHPGYVCKYITKSPQTRVRASRRYGQAPSERTAPRTD